MDLPEFAIPADHWRGLPAAARSEALGLLARLITRGVLVEAVKDPVQDVAEVSDDER